MVGRERLVDFIAKHADSKSWIESWLAEVEECEWTSPQDIKDRYPQASILADNIYIFNVKGNRYRMAVQVAFNAQVLSIKKIGTHAEYDRWKF